MKLRRLREQDAKRMHAWMRDSEVTEHLRTDFSEKTEEDCLRFIRQAQTDGQDLHRAVCDREDRYMGTVSLKNIHPETGSAEFAITVCKEAMGKGYAQYGMRELLRYGREELGLSRIYWCVSKNNTRAVRFYERCGYLRAEPHFPELRERYSGEERAEYLWYEYSGRIRPLVSFCIISYNDEKYIREALESALRQSYEPMEVILSDDASHDRTVEIAEQVKREYRGNKELRIYRNEKNLGIRENCNRLLYELCRGEIILLGGGDDCSLPERAERYVRCFSRFPELMSISCLSQEMNEDMTELLNPEAGFDGSLSLYTLRDYLSNQDFVLYPGDSRGFRRELIRAFPPLAFPRAEDIYLFVRSLILGSGAYLREPLVRHRNHGSNASRKKEPSYEPFSRQMEADILHALREGYLTEELAGALRRKTRHTRELFELYYGDQHFASPKAFLYYVLNVLFGVRK